MARSFWSPTHVAWPSLERSLDPAEIAKGYAAGWTGVYRDPEADEAKRAAFAATGGFADFEDAAIASGVADAYAGQLVIPFVLEAVLFPGSLPGPAQERGDCVSHGITKACVGSLVGDIADGHPDEETGKVEGPPEVPPAGVLHGVLSTEWPWWHRGYRGDGWSTGPATQAVMKSGVLVRQAYPDLGIDLTQYSYKNTALYSNSPGEKFEAVGRLHCVTSGADISTFEGLRDALGNLHGIATEGGEGYSSVRDEFGMSGRRGSWSHAYPFKGADDRPETRAKFGEPLVLQMNNWGANWNSGPRDIWQSAALVPSLCNMLVKVGFLPAADPVQIKQRLVDLDVVNPATGNIMIPRGSWWSRWSDVKNRGIQALAGIRGWTRKVLPNLGATGRI